MIQIRRILIANRGEIASRVIRTCRKMGITSVAVFSDADRSAMFVKEADLAVHIGESMPSRSYLDIDKIITAAKDTNADAIHPGYGFLSENPVFAARCANEGIVFIGPNPSAIEAMGSKSKAKLLMIDAGVPVVPGYSGADQSLASLEKEAANIGFPVLLKASAGGGGKGMRIVHHATDFATAFEAAKREADAAFGSNELIVEKYITSSRHIEFQIFGDKDGNAIHLLERECTIQRRYQKVVEESPSPILSEELRTEMGAIAVKAALAIKYDNAGTVEFILDNETQKFYFLEVNTRLQVEHPVTEEITGLDLVQMQIETAAGKPLDIKQREVTSDGYAIEVRLYAEDVANDFSPVTGTIAKFEVPKVDGLRVETALESGTEVSVFYDPMIAKLIMHAENRAIAHGKLAYVLEHLICQEVLPNQEFLLTILRNKDFQEGLYDTDFIEKQLETDFSKPAEARAVAGIAATLMGWQNREDERKLLKGLPSGWRNSFYKNQSEVFRISGEPMDISYRFSEGQFHFAVDEVTYEVSIQHRENDNLRVEINGMQQSFSIVQQGMLWHVQGTTCGQITLEQLERFPVKEKEKVKGGYEAPMPSQVVRILVEKGQHITFGTPLIIISSMKMENTLTSEEEGVVEEIFTTEGANVAAGFLLMKVKEEQ